MAETGTYVNIASHQVRLLSASEVLSGDESHIQHIFIIGSKGIPAQYGGFETFVEKLTQYRSNSHIQYHVARMAEDTLRFEYNHAECFDVDVPNIGSAKAIYYDMAALKQSIQYCREHPEIEHPIFYILACRIGPFAEDYHKKIHELGGVLWVNPDGHEWKRAKWSAPVRKYWKFSEKLMVKNADLLICDSKNIERYFHHSYKKYHPKTVYIAYGSETSASRLTDRDEKYRNWMTAHKLRPKKYYLIVGRFVPENNFEIMIREFMRSNTKRDLAIITTPNGPLYNKLKHKLHFDRDKRIKFVGTVYDEELLKKIRENAFAYLHGHEVGGTNPSLLEALGSTKLNLLLNVGFNKEVAEEAAFYWTKEKGNLADLISRTERQTAEEIDRMGEKAKKRVQTAYSWEFITSCYEQLFLEKHNIAIQNPPDSDSCSAAQVLNSESEEM